MLLCCDTIHISIHKFNYLKTFEIDGAVWEMLINFLQAVPILLWFRNMHILINNIYTHTVQYYIILYLIYNMNHEPNINKVFMCT